MKFGLWIAMTLVAGLEFTPQGAEACGIDWTVPRNHFDGVDEFGHVSYWEKVGDLDLGKGLNIPLIIGFKSNRNWRSPYLGTGWVLALLDSRFEQISENSFDMIQPDGWIRGFGRGNVNDRVLGGAGGWKAEISGDMITASAPCGWKLVFVKGKLRSMTTPQNRTLTLSASADSFVTTVQDGLSTVLRVETGMNGQVKALVYGSDQRRIEIELGKKPNVQAVGGQNVVAGMEESLSKLTLPDGSVRSYEFGVDGGIRPTLKITEADTTRLMTWDPATQRIVADNNWTYNISAPNGLTQNADIERANSRGQREIWFYDPVNGRETNQSVNGGKTVKTWFTSGALAGKERKIDRFINGTPVTVHRCAYDEKGVLFREWTPEKGSIRIEKVVTDNLILEKRYSDKDSTIMVNIYAQNGDALGTAPIEFLPLVLASLSKR